MPDEIKYDASATPAQFTNNADMVIEQGTHVRIRIIGMRAEVGDMWAIGSINGDFLGYVLSSGSPGSRGRMWLGCLHVFLAAASRHDSLPESGRTIPNYEWALAGPMKYAHGGKHPKGLDCPADTRVSIPSPPSHLPLGSRTIDRGRMSRAGTQQIG